MTLSPRRKLSVRIAALLTLAIIMFAGISAVRSQTGIDSEFADPTPVVVRGYSGVEMEPFISKDGHYLFFNNSNSPNVNTDIYWATRINKTMFDFQGEIKGVNTPALEGVPSMDAQGRFYFISPCSYSQTLETVYAGNFLGGTVSGVAPVEGVSVKKPGTVDFDAEISGDGNTLCFAEGQFAFGHLVSAQIVVAHKKGSAFVRDPASASLLRTVNAGTLNYAPSISTNGLDLYFTRAMTFPQMVPSVYVAHRLNLTSPFGEPQRIADITGFAEAPSLTADGKTLYYHEKVGDSFQIYCVSRP